MTCPICGTETDDHDKRFHRLDTFLRAYSKVQAALVDRVAKLERAAMHCNTCGGRCDGDCEEGDEQFENERIASGQPASAGGAPKRCPHGVPSHLGCWNCTSYPVKVGYIGVVAPPAEQPAPAAGTLLANATVTCGYCGEYGYLGLDHWERCAKHPAHAKLAQAERGRDEWRGEATARLNVAVTAKRERDEARRQVEQMAEHVATMRVERDEWKELAHKEKRNATDATRDLENALVQSEVRVDEATARERERCLAWAQADVDNGKIAEAISNGAPAPKCDPDPPREVAPDRTQAEDCARCPVCRWPLAETVDKGCVPGNCSYRPRERGNP